MRLRHLALLADFATLVVPAGAGASTLIDRKATSVTLNVNNAGQALVSYTARGKRWNVLAWNAVNAVPPTPGAKQVDFRLDYSGGPGSGCCRTTASYRPRNSPFRNSGSRTGPANSRP